MKLLVVRDESSKILGHRYLNSQISFYIGLIQLAVCIWAMAQHVYSLVHYNKILFCDFVNGTEPMLLLGVDAIIFDIGLFHSLWGIESCVAQHLDGGYGRCMWCICHIVAFVMCLPFAFVSRPRPYSLWPLLIQQSAYGVGLLILSLAALPRVLPTFTGDQDSAFVFSVSVYAAGATLNFFLLYIYWHWYWHVESVWNSVRKLRTDRAIPNTNQRSRQLPFKQFKHTNITDAIAPLQIPAHGLLQQGQRSIPPDSAGKPLKTFEQVIATVPENLHRAEPNKPDDFNNSAHHCVQSAEGAVYHGYRNELLTGASEQEKLLGHNSMPNNNDLPQYAVYDNGFLSSESHPQQPISSATRCRWRSPRHQLSQFSSRAFYPSVSSQMGKPSRTCRFSSARRTEFAGHFDFGDSQRKPLVRQLPKQYTHGGGPRHHVIAPPPAFALADEYHFAHQSAHYFKDLLFSDSS